MRRSRITITLNKRTLDGVDRLIDHNKIRNRSHAIEYVLGKYIQGSAQKAVILAGGQGTQLRPYTLEVPKPLFPVKGKPILEYTILRLKENNIVDIIICLGHLGEKIKDYFGDGKKFGVHITYVEEKKPLQTGGALLLAKKYVEDGTFLVIHGDILTTISFQDLVEYHKKEHDIATIAVAPSTDPKEYGQISLNGTRLVDFYQKDNSKDVQSLLIHAGMYVFEPEIFSYFPKNTQSFALEDVMQTLIKQKKVHGFLFEGQWFDVGTTDNYEKAIKEYKG